MMQFFRKYWITLLGIVLGAIGGYIYHYFWGCVDACPIKSSVWKMMGYGALMGGLLLNILQDYLGKRSEKK